MNKIVANPISLNKPVTWNTKAKITAVTVANIYAPTAAFSGETVGSWLAFFLASGVCGPALFLNKLKSISIPLRNINNNTPKVEAYDSNGPVWTISSALLPKIIPTIISATEVGKMPILNRDKIIGVAKAAKVTNTKEKSIIKSPFSRFKLSPFYTSLS